MIVDGLFIILEQALLYFPLVLGAYISISLIKVPDLSIEAAYVFGAIMAVKFLPFAHEHHNLGIFILMVMASAFGGLIVGVISSSLTKIARIPHLLSSILTLGLFHGINQWVLGSSMCSLSEFESPLTFYVLFNKNPELFSLALIFLLLLLGSLLLFKTQLGYSFAMYGNNPNFFEHYGISSRYVFITGIVVSNALAGISGYFVAQSSGFIDVNAGSGIALFCVTSLILGKILSNAKKNVSVVIPVTGIVLYCLLQQILLKVGFNLKYFTMIQSLIVLFVLVNRYRTSGSKRVRIDNLGL